MTCVPLTDGRKVLGFLCTAAPAQPATRWRETVHLSNGSRTFVHRTPSHRLFWTQCCQKRRPAKNLTVRAGNGWYDPEFFCREGKGCSRET